MTCHTRHIFSVMALTACLSACNDDATTPLYTVGAADNAIVLRAGLNEGGNGVTNRALANPDANHSKHESLSPITKIALRIDGVWKEHSPEIVRQATTATIGNFVADTNEKHREVTFTDAERLYWDDYGTADPANMPDVADNGRDRGLDIYGVAVNNITTAPAKITSSSTATESEWTAYPWSVYDGSVGATPSGDIDQSSGWSTLDLLTSNNVKWDADDAKDNAYKFKDRNAGKLLEFTHAMSKITVTLTAGEGFPEYTTSPTNAHFAEAPTVTLLGFNYKGTIDVVSGTPTPADGAVANIKTQCIEGGAPHTAKYDALVFPGNTFDDATRILKLNADGNIYYVTAKEINTAMEADVGHQETAKFLRGYNYHIKVTVNKTGIKVSATVKDWDTVEAAEVSPVINVGTTFTGTGGAAPTGFTAFDFFRSASQPYEHSPSPNLLKEYSADSGLKENNFYEPEAVVSAPSSGDTKTTPWTFDKALYWPNHYTHYHFRGVWPKTVTTADASYTNATYDWKAPRVRMNSANDAQVIDIKNVAYQKEDFPSDLLIGMPELSSGTQCTNDDHTKVNQSQYGICATEGLVTLNFRYVMSQVEVQLSTSDVEIDKVKIGADTKVEIVGLATQGEVRLGDREVIASTTMSDYILDDTTDAFTRHSAIVPQILPYTTPGASGNARFKITVNNDDGTTDIYYADIFPILKKDSSSEKVAPNGKWESGVHYVYHLKLTKTLIKASATITDWVTVQAAENVWF